MTDSNASFVSESMLGSHVKMFDHMLDAMAHARKTITAKHVEHQFLVGISPSTLRYYLIVLSSRTQSIRWLEEQGFHVLWLHD